MRFAEIDKPFLLQDAYCAFCTCQAAARSLSGHDPGNSMFTSWVEEVLKPQTFIFWIFLPKSTSLVFICARVPVFRILSCWVEIALQPRHQVWRKGRVKGEVLLHSHGKISKVIFVTRVLGIDATLTRTFRCFLKFGRSEANVESGQSPNDEEESEDVEIEQGRFVCQPSWFMPTSRFKRCLFGAYM